MSFLYVIAEDGRDGQGQENTAQIIVNVMQKHTDSEYGLLVHQSVTQRDNVNNVNNVDSVYDTAFLRNALALMCNYEVVIAIVDKAYMTTLLAINLQKVVMHVFMLRLMLV